MSSLFLGTPSGKISDWFVNNTPSTNDKLRMVVEASDNYNGRNLGIYSAQRDVLNKPIVIDWGDGNVE